MTKRNKIILVVVGLIAVIGVIFFAIFTKPSEKEKLKEKAAVKEGAGVTAESPFQKNIQTRQPTPEEIAQMELQTLSTSFTERFGTYSNDGKFENIVDLYPLMTNLMKSWAEKYVEKMRKETQKENYQGVTTRVLKVEFTSLDLDKGMAETKTKTQRTELKMENGQLVKKVYYEDLRLEFLKVGSEWKVDGAYWLHE